MYTTTAGHRFAPIDVRRTLPHGTDLLDEFVDDHHAVLIDRRMRIGALAGDIDVDGSTPAESEKLLEHVWLELLGARDDLAAAVRLPETASGHVAALHAGDGGVQERCRPRGRRSRRRRR